VRQVAAGDRYAFVELFDTLAEQTYTDLAATGVARNEAVTVVSSTFVEVWWLARFHTGASADIEQWVAAIASRREADRRASGEFTSLDDTAENTNRLAAITLAHLLSQPERRTLTIY
jgi:RNA polymerase sigma-70 factor (ECF subfamily)